MYYLALVLWAQRTAGREKSSHPEKNKYISSPGPLPFVDISSGIVCVKISKMLELPKISCSFPLVLIERPSNSGVRA